MIKRTYIMVLTTKVGDGPSHTTSATLSKRSFFEKSDMIHTRLKALLMGINRVTEEDIEEVLFRRI